MANPRENRDRQRLRQALEKSTSTPHRALVPNWKKSENEQQSQLRRARVSVAPSAPKQNTHNNSVMKKGAKLVKAETVRAAEIQTGQGARSRRAFGVKPLELI